MKPPLTAQSRRCWRNVQLFSKLCTSMLIIDGSAMVTTLSPTSSRTFECPVPNAVTLCKHKGTDIVFDVYRSNRLKTEAKSTEARTWVKWRVSNKCKIPSNWRIFLGSKRRFHSKHMIHLDELVLCTHEEADTMIYVHTKHATKVRGPEGVLMVKDSDTDILFIALHTKRQFYISFWPRSALSWFLSMNCAPPWATKEQRHSRLHQSRDVMLCLPSAAKKRRLWCMWWDNWCRPQTKSVSTNSNWRWHADLGEVCIKMYMTDPAQLCCVQLRASLMPDWNVRKETETIPRSIISTGVPAYIC